MFNRRIEFLSDLQRRQKVLLTLLFAVSISAAASTQSAQDAEPISQQVLGVKSKGHNTQRALYGFIDTSGKMVIQPQFSDALRFSHGLAECHEYQNDRALSYWSKIIFIDKHGNKLVSEPAFLKPRSIGDKKIYSQVNVGELSIIQDREVYIMSRRGDFVLVRKEPYGEIYVCDKNMNIVKKIPDQWVLKGENPRSGNIWFKVEGDAFEFSGNSGSSVVAGFKPIKMPDEFSTRFIWLDGFHDGLSAAMDESGHWCYIDASGKVVIDLPADCSNAQAFSEGLAAVSIGGKKWHDHASVSRISPKRGAKFGYIDKNGQFKIPPNFPAPPNIVQGEFSFHDGFAKITGDLNGDIAYGVIDKTGTVKASAIYASIGKFSEGLASVNTQRVGFRPDLWADTKTISGEPYLTRSEHLEKFLREYSLVECVNLKLKLCLVLRPRQLCLRI